VLDIITPCGPAGLAGLLTPVMSLVKELFDYYNNVYAPQENGDGVFSVVDYPARAFSTPAPG
jgi:hypothetical protein